MSGFKQDGSILGMLAIGNFDGGIGDGDVCGGRQPKLNEAGNPLLAPAYPSAVNER